MTARDAAHRGQVVAARQVVDMFATETLLALDRYGRSLPAGTDSARRTADTFARWWRRLKMDDAWRAPGAGGPDAEQILGKAAALALDRDNDLGLTAEDAAAQANMIATANGRPMPLKSIADFQREFDTAYGGKADLPGPEKWLAQSLTRLARASVLRDVVTRGAQVELSQPLRDAAGELARQGQEYLDGRRELGAQQQLQAASRASEVRDTLTVAGCVAYGVGVSVSGAPPGVQLAMIVPALAVTVRQAVKDWTASQRPAGPGLDPAQAQLRSVRADLANTLDTPTPATRRDTRAIRNATTRRPDHGR